LSFYIVLNAYVVMLHASLSRLSLVHWNVDSALLPLHMTGHWHLTKEPPAQSEAASREIQGGQSGTGAGFLLLILSPSLLHTHLTLSLMCAVALTRQRNIIPSVFKFGASCLIQHLAGLQSEVLCTSAVFN
jgi:hypothetical protein